MSFERRKMASSGSKYRCQDSLGISCGKVGEMAEWFKAHAWKACVGNTTVSSNLTLSATPLTTLVFHVCEVKGAAGPIHRPCFVARGLEVVAPGWLSGSFRKVSSTPR